MLPSDGAYRIAVHGYDVRVTPATFSIKISAVQGGDISVQSPAGTVFPGQPVRFDLHFNSVEPGSEAIILLGPRGAHSAIDVPVRVLP